VSRILWTEGSVGKGGQLRLAGTRSKQESNHWLLDRVVSHCSEEREEGGLYSNHHDKHLVKHRHTKHRGSGARR